MVVTQYLWHRGIQHQKTFIEIHNIYMKKRIRSSSKHRNMCITSSVKKIIDGLHINKINNFTKMSLSFGFFSKF